MLQQGHSNQLAVAKATTTTSSKKAATTQQQSTGVDK